MLTVGLWLALWGIASGSGCECGAKDEPHVWQGSGAASSGGGSSAAGAVGAGGGGVGGMGNAAGAGLGGGGQGGTECVLAADCSWLGPATCIHECVDGRCAVGVAPAGTPCATCGGDVCDGASLCVPTDHCQSVDCLWSKAFGGGWHQAATGLAVDADGAAALSGWFLGRLTLGDTAHDNPVSDEGDPAAAFVAKLAATGHCEWSLSFGEDSEAYAEAVAYDPTGDVLLAGYFEGGVSIGGLGLTSVDLTDIVVAKLRGSTGGALWARRFGGLGRQMARDVAVDTSGNAYVVGQFDETLDLGDGSPLVSAGRYDVFVAKLSPEGEVLWSRRYGGPAHDRGSRVAIGPDGGPLVVGVFEEGADLGAGPVASEGDHDLFVLALDGDGALRYSHTFGSASEDDALDVAVSADGAVAVTGAAGSLIDFGGGPICDEGDEMDPDAYVAVFAPDGSHLWSRCMGWNYFDYGTAVVWDPAGDLLLTGTFYEHVDPGGGSLYCGVLHNIFVARYARTGEFLASACYGGPHYEVTTNMALDPWGRLLLAGYFMGELDLGTGLLEECLYDYSADHFGYDVFVAKTEL